VKGKDLLRLGKLPIELLSELLSKYPGRKSSRVVVGAKVGEDAAVVDFGDVYLVAKTDPITFVSEDIGWYALNVNANDIAAMGAEPRWFLATILLPEGSSTPELAERIFSSIHRAASSIGVAICGGHTEVTYGLDRPIVVGAMFGEVPKDRLVRSDGARPGDTVILTKGLAIEATSIIAKEKGDELLRRGYAPSFIERCSRYLYDPGISVLKEARAACRAARVHAMHDPTEGGVAMGLHEVALASGVGMEIFSERLFLAEEAKVLLGEFELNPLGAISSGALIIIVDSGDSARVLEAIRAEGIRCEAIGYVREKSFGVKLNSSGELSDMPRFTGDEISKIFG